MEVSFSIIIVNYNVKYFLEQCLESVLVSDKEFRKVYPHFNNEVFVVDNDSKDDSVEMVSVKYPEVKLIANKVNVGFSKANNQAIRLAEGKYVLLLNPDTLIGNNCLIDCFDFMQSHPDAGGVGVKMIDGKGIFLPESKRGLPTPFVSFSKIVGLSKIFPKSKIFGNYHLGYLNKDHNHEIEVLAGAFMLMPKSVLDKVGLLDEQFFMYGEDIDLSYRIILGGYKNYYLADVPIIHYKGESTKKGSLNYVKVFYQAMVIFAEKHFTKGDKSLYAKVIKYSVFLRAIMSIFKRIVELFFVPFFEFIVQMGIWILIINYWQSTVKYIKGTVYPKELYTFYAPIYTLIFILGLFLAGSYIKPYTLKKTFRGVFLGTIILSLIYAFLPESQRYSRAIILLGALGMLVSAILARWIKSGFKKPIIDATKTEDKKILIVGTSTEANRVLKILDNIKLDYALVGIITPTHTDCLDGKYLGSILEFDYLVKIFTPDEIIFCSDGLSNDWIIKQMERLSSFNIDFKTVPPNSEFVVGSNSKNRPGDFYTLDLNLNINKPEYLFYKRLIDILLGLTFLAFSPLLLIFQSNKIKLIPNLIQVILGRKTFIGLNLPNIASKGIHIPTCIIQNRGIKSTLEDRILERLDYLYCKKYSPLLDIQILLKNLKYLGN